VRRAFVLLLVLAPVACHHARPPSPHYVLGEPYQSDGAWFYPRESYQADETGFAAVYQAGHGALTTDAEAFDQSVLAAAHPTLQLPAIARLTDLDTGRQVLVRINDRGHPTPHRLQQVTRRTATLLGFPPDGVARVRLQVLPVESHAAADELPGAPMLALTAAPRGAVQAAELPPPGTAAQPVAAPAPAPEARPAQPAQATIARLPETVTQTPPNPGSLFVLLGAFHTFQYADIQRAQVGGLGARIVSTWEGRVRTYRVIIGPLADERQADTMLDRVLGAGVTDARIIVE